MATDTKKAQFTEVPARINSDELEREILAYWDHDQIFEKSLEQTKDGERFSFYDGPPYATGKPHYGHILQSAIKDTVLRYKTMQGYYVPRRVGWDCHGLPVETLVEKELGIKNKREIEEMGIDKFNEACRNVVFRYIDDFTNTLKRMGRWADYDNAYATLNQEYMESEWWVFKQLWDQDLVYKAFRSTPYCIRCATPLSNFEVTSNYKDRTDETVYVMLKIKSPTSLKLRGADQQYLLIWTTTPWTLPGNVAVAIHPDIHYVSVKHEDKALVVAKDRVAALFGADAEVIKEWTTEELLTLEYEPLYTFLPNDHPYVVVPGPHVTAQDGTGLVHMAPAFGEEDALVGKEQGLPTLKTVDTNGQFIPEITPWAGHTVFDANASIIADLTSKGVLFKQETYTHSYPFCWRCDTPLIYYALDTWFVKVSDLKDQMLQTNEDINWTPKHVQHGRFGKGIESAPDWAVSRNRYWSVPVPIWECAECEHRQAFGSVAEIEKFSGKKVTDLHRPLVDAIAWSCQECGKGQMKRVPEVLDVWFDSGSMPYAQWHYPFENKEQVESTYPADFIAESIEMTRAWFYVLHVLAAGVTRPEAAKLNDLPRIQPAFKNAIASGIIFAEDGQKLSKKLKNYPEIEPTMQKYGADVLRFYLLASTALGEPYYFSEKEIQLIQRNVYGTLWNVYSFFTRYALVQELNAASFASPMASEANGQSSNILDQWVLARLAQLEQSVITHMNEYQIDQAARQFITFVDDLSNWYVRRARARFQRPASDQERDEAFGTLYHMLAHTSQLLAPFMPFVSETMYRNLTGKESVHLSVLPTEVTGLSAEQTEVLDQMKQVRDIVSAGLALRAQAKLKVRQPLATLVVQGTESIASELADIICEEVNVKAVQWADSLPTANYIQSGEDSITKVALNTELTPELKQEGIAREVIRHGQVLRREANYALNDRIKVMIQTDDAELQQLIMAGQDMIQTALQADELTDQELSEIDKEATVKVEGKQVKIGVTKA